MSEVKRDWKNWITVKELSEKWTITPRRVSQILQGLGMKVEIGLLVRTERHLLHVQTPIYRLREQP